MDNNGETEEEAIHSVAKILAVDDEEQWIKLIESSLKELDYHILTARDGVEALLMVERELPDVILLDISMPGINGIEVAKSIKKNEKTRLIPIVMLSGLHDVEHRIEAMQAGADDFLSKPVDTQELVTRVKTLLKVKKYNDYMHNYQEELEKEVEEKTKEIKDTSLETIYYLARASEFRDEETGNHTKRLSKLAASLYYALGRSGDETETIMYAAPMHDVGKIGIPDSILLKPDKLIAKEWEIMQKHTVIGGKILEGSRSKYVKMGHEIAISHHEKWNGSGYPRGLRNDDIPLSGRVTAVVDVFDALTSKRPYRSVPYSVSEAFDIIRNDRGKHFDPRVADAFLSMRKTVAQITDKYENGGQSWLHKVSQI
jgi:putative two-component system response regulator